MCWGVVCWGGLVWCGVVVSCSSFDGVLGDGFVAR